jgi:hypothetical protein
MNIRELLTKLDEIETPSVDDIAAGLKPSKNPGHYEYGMWSDEPATIQATEYAIYKDVKELIDKYLALVEKRKSMSPVKESELAKALMESFGYEYLTEKPAMYNSPEYVSNYDKIFRQPTAAVAPAVDAVAPAVDAVAPAATKTLAGRAGDFAKSGWKGSAGFVGLGIDAAISCWQGYKQLSSLPADMPIEEKSEAVHKIIGHLVARFGIRTVGVVMGAAIGGLATGPFALVGSIAGSIIGGLGAEWLAGDSADALADKVVDALYGPSKKSVAAQAKWPTTTDEIKAFQKSHKDADGKPLAVDGLIGNKTLGALKAAGATPPKDFVAVKDKPNSGEKDSIKPNVAAQSVDTTVIDKQIEDLKTQIQAGLTQMEQSKNPEVVDRAKKLRAKLGTDFAPSTLSAPAPVSQKITPAPIEPIKGPIPKLTVPAGTTIGN